MSIRTIKIKPSLYVTIDDEKQIPIEKKEINFLYVINSKEVIMEAKYFNKDGLHYWPYEIINPHKTKEIYNFSMELFDKMKEDNYSETFGKGIDIIEYFNVKTISGACRKFESYSFNWDKEYGYYFCKGERNVVGFSWYRNYVIGSQITEENFIMGYNKMLTRIEKKLMRKEMKKNKK